MTVLTTKELLIRFGWDSPQYEDWVRAIYMTWIYGRSTRAIGLELGCDKNAVADLLEAAYGVDAVNRGAKSLLRSLAEDYPDDITVEAFIATNLGVMETKTGESRTEYLCVYNGGDVVPKILVTPVYAQHRSNHSMQELTKAQCLGDAIVQHCCNRSKEVDE